MGKSWCFVPGCTSGYDCELRENKRLGIRNRSMFKAKGESQLLKWRKAIPRLDRVLSESDVVCELHFPDSDIIRFFETRLFDGSVHRIARERPTLKPEAIPTVFPNLPKYLSKKHTPRKPPKDRSYPVATCSRAVEIEITPDVNVSEPHVNLCMLADLALALEPAEVLEDVPVPSTPVEGFEVPEPAFSFSCILEACPSIALPGKNWATAIVNDSVIFLCVGVDFRVWKTLVIDQELNVKVFLYGKEVIVDGFHAISTLENLRDAIVKLDLLKICAGMSKDTSDDARLAADCNGYIDKESMMRGNRGRRPSDWCPPCRSARKLLADRERRKRVCPPRVKSSKGTLRTSRLKASRLQRKVGELKKKMTSIQEKWAGKSQEALEEDILCLPRTQQEAVKACFAAAQAGNAKGRRYTREWVYECLLLRIKSRKAYEHIRSHGILALPSITTLSRYLSHVKGSYGFHEATFRCLQEKAHEIPVVGRRGVLLVDEMKLSQAISFDRQSLKINGFTDLGDYTPLHQKNERGDHALVMMYQPFRGRWVQAVACFLSKGCASSTVLHHLIMECIILLEKSGFHVDLVTTDGAQWNRSMWKLFGIEKEKPSCEHPYDSSRRLWFSSDLPHLIKNLRNFITSHEETWTPDGVLKLKHWETVVMLDNVCSFQLKACPKLTADHVHPKPYQKMNVGRAFQFFGRSVAAAMNMYKPRHHHLDDCQPSSSFIERIAGLIHVMNSRTPHEALAKDTEAWESIVHFIQYLEDWEKAALNSNYYFLSKSTSVGFHVTLRSTLELLEFLQSEYDFSYLMTSRMNQDALERFFGMMRSACGANDHPDPVLFIQTFRLISTYSLIKPPKGSNISGGEMLTSLMSVKDIESVSLRQEKLQGILDLIVDKGNVSDELTDVIRAVEDHDYFPNHSSDFVLSYFSGYVARKCRRFTTCESCLESVVSQVPDEEERDFLIDFMSRGHLTRSSLRLFTLMRALEDRVVEALTTKALNADTVFDIASAVADIESLPLVGCIEHCWTLTEAIVHFFVITRVHFACKVANRADNIQQEKARLHRKVAKLQ